MGKQIVVDDELINYYYEEFEATKKKYKDFGQELNLTFDQYLSGELALLKHDDSLFLKTVRKVVSKIG